MAFGIGAVGSFNTILAAKETQNFTVTNAEAFNAGLTTSVGANVNGSVNYSTATGYYASTFSVGTNSSMGTTYSFYDQGQTVGSQNWGFGINTNSYVNAKLRVGDAKVPTEALDVNGNARVSGTVNATNGTFHNISGWSDVTFDNDIQMQGNTLVFGNRTRFINYSAAYGKMSISPGITTPSLLADSVTGSYGGIFGGTLDANVITAESVSASEIYVTSPKSLHISPDPQYGGEYLCVLEGEVIKAADTDGCGSGPPP
jgi:hypothetical protein